MRRDGVERTMVEETKRREPMEVNTTETRLGEREGKETRI